MNSDLSECITGFAGSGECGNRPCCEVQGVECCGDCEFFNGGCSSACGWYKEAVKEKGMVEKPYWKELR